MQIIFLLPVIYIAGIIGFLLFYIQHQFDPSFWTRNESWDYERVALEESSYYKLPRILQYFTGNIGFHHIPHLSPMIPNYNLSRCHRENSIFNQIQPLKFWTAFTALTFRLWNEKTSEMISFRKLKLT
jgi:omega-6 fatty acid desaturase (delta-12 desaturase)